MGKDEDALEALKREYTTGLWWITFSRSFGEVGRAYGLAHDIAEKQAQLATLRKKYVKRGRGKRAELGVV